MTDTPDTAKALTSDLRALLEKATALPWIGVPSDNYVIEAAAYPKEYGGRFKEDGTGFYLAEFGNHPKDYGEANRDLAVAAVNALPALLDRVEAAEKDRAILILALHDAIARPKGVVPDSASRFYDPTRAQLASEWRDLSATLAGAGEKP